MKDDRALIDFFYIKKSQEKKIYKGKTASKFEFIRAVDKLPCSLSWGLEKEDSPDIVLDMWVEEGYTFNEEGQGYREWLYISEGMKKAHLWYLAIQAIKLITKQ